MKGIKILSLLLIILTCSCSEKKSRDHISKYNQAATKYTEIQQIISEEVEDTFYVYVRLPKYYNETDNKYPVLYLLDGDISFNMATSVVRYLQYGRHVPDMVIVAPAYGTMMSDKETNYRERDYTPSKIERFKGSGDAGNYLGFIKNELIPIIDSLYRTDKTRILSGFSLGGLFTLYMMSVEPHLFDNYIAGSPYLKNDIEMLENRIETLPSSSGMKKLFVSVGELENKEDYHGPIRRILDIASEKENLHIKFKEFDKGTHFTTPSEALAYGLTFIFNEDVEQEP